MMSESQKCYASFGLFLTQPIINPSVLLSLGVIMGHKAQYYPTAFNPNGVQMGDINMNFHSLLLNLC